MYIKQMINNINKLPYGAELKYTIQEENYDC